MSFSYSDFTAALKAGKHVACTVPMATNVEDCLEIIRLTRETGLKYMMMETVVYAREYLFMKQLSDRGELGKLQFIQASHQQDMDGWPNYWPGLPPMWYATHCVGPVLGLAGVAGLGLALWPSMAGIPAVIIASARRSAPRMTRC